MTAIRCYKLCFDAGVEYIMIPGVDRGTVESGLALAKQYDRLYAVGTHPHESSKIFTGRLRVL